MLFRSGSGQRLELPAERRPRASSPSRLDDDRLSVGDSRSLDSLDNGDLVSLLDTPGDAQLPKAWAGPGKAGGLSLDLSHVQAYEQGDSGSQTPGSMPSTPSPLETAKPFPGGPVEREASSSLTEDSFLFSDDMSLGESFSCAEEIGRAHV